MVLITNDLFTDLFDNTVECFNAASEKGDKEMMREYKKDIDACEKIQEELSDDT